MPRQDALREWKHFKEHGFCYDLGSLAYDYLVSEGKIPDYKEMSENQRKKAYIEFEKYMLTEYESLHKRASDKMKPYWEYKINNLRQTLKSKMAMKTIEKAIVSAKRYLVNEYFSAL